MKKKGILALLLSMLLVFSLSACSGGNPEVEAALEGKTFYCNGGTVNSTYAITFTDGSTSLVCQFADGNGVHDSTESGDTGTYSIDDTNITITWESHDEMVIPYVLDGENITLADGAYRTADQVKEDLQGIWKYRKVDFVLGIFTEDEHNLKFEGDTVVYQHASKATYGAPGEYYYYGPYNCSYVIDGCKIILSGEEDKELFFTIETEGDNKNTAVPFNYSNKFAKTDTFPGVNDYQF